MKAIVVYYSLGGNTASAAEAVAQKTGADLLRLEPVKAYPSGGFRKFFWGGKAAVMAERPPLNPCAFDASAYDTVVFGFPVWAGNIAPPLRTFLAENDVSGLRCAAFACQSGSGAERAFRRLEECLGRGLAQTLVLIDPKDRPDPANERKIDDFCASLG